MSIKNMLSSFCASVSDQNLERDASYDASALSGGAKPTLGGPQ